MTFSFWTRHSFWQWPVHGSSNETSCPPFAPFELTVKLWDTSSSFCSLLVKTQHQLCGGEWRPTTAQNLGNGHVVHGRWNRTTAQQLGEIEEDTKRVKRVMFDGRVGVAESQRDEHPLVKECAKRASAILFYSTLLFFFIPCSFSFFSSPLYLSIDKVHSFQKRNNGQVRSWNASSLRRRSLLAFDEQVTD